MTQFYASIPPAVWDLADAAAVERFAAGASVPRDAIAGLTPAQLTAFPAPGTWSIQQIVVHLADADAVAAYRMRRIIAEDQPRLDAYDENAFVARLHYQEADAALACEAFRVGRERMAEILRRVPPAAFARVGLHPEVGELPLGRLLRVYVHHLDHHMRFLREKRRMVEGGGRG